MKGFLFIPEMAVAVCEDRKTHTRRVIGPQPEAVEYWIHGKPSTRTEGISLVMLPGQRFRSAEEMNPYGRAGERRCLLTTWAVPRALDTLKPSQITVAQARCGFWHAGMKDKPDWVDRAKKRPGRFLPNHLRHPVFVPLLEIVSVRAERVQDISEADAKAEGIGTIEHCGTTFWKNYLFETAHPRKGVTIDGKKHRIRGLVDPRHCFESLWDSINAKRTDEHGKLLPFAWSDNPWVWAITFKRVTP